ncbi:hypothetical protein JAAARDRAFT_34605 [Jaapia argillacea MUCL 33604]|uniref:Uncharacterized protein n=1 Tax=Jaapia argillacea MUCL 33604 TaxID=933084 RepID=A0A067PXZ4_9AGAM|nr:hypothetical protein JAAARDRAFT_34605 [Jaapia argillacea MUCL 33604]
MAQVASCDGSEAARWVVWIQQKYHMPLQLLFARRLGVFFPVLSSMTGAIYPWMQFLSRLLLQPSSAG